MYPAAPEAATPVRATVLFTVSVPTPPAAATLSSLGINPATVPIAAAVPPPQISAPQEPEPQLGTIETVVLGVSWPTPPAAAAPVSANDLLKPNVPTAPEAVTPVS
jgi:hypothetical protein